MSLMLGLLRTEELSILSLPVTTVQTVQTQKVGKGTSLMSLHYPPLSRIQFFSVGAIKDAGRRYWNLIRRRRFLPARVVTFGLSSIVVPKVSMFVAGLDFSSAGLSGLLDGLSLTDVVSLVTKAAFRRSSDTASK